MGNAFMSLFGIRRERANIPRIAEAACKEGFAVIAVRPGDKSPLCTLTAAETKRADNEAKETAKAEGKDRWEHAAHLCGRHHAMTDPAKAKRVFTRLLKQGATNIGIEPGASRWLCVDADQEEDVVAWMRHWSERNDDPGLLDGAPTVTTPGVHRDGSWRHKGGGHIWFWLPEGVDFSKSDIRQPMPSVAGCQVYFNDALILAPPSVRPEGEYEVLSDACQAPQWLIDDVVQFIDEQTQRAEAQRQSYYDGDSPIDHWSLTQPWDELLSADGWTWSHKVDRCACPIWTRPGDDRGSYKSATAHEPGCLKFDVDGTGFLHLWTDNAPGFLQDYVRATGKKSVTKFDYVAWRDYSGDRSAAFVGLDLGEGSAGGGFGALLLSEDAVVPEPRTEEDSIAEAVAAPEEDDDIGRGFIRTQIAYLPTAWREGTANEIARQEMAAFARKIRADRDLFLAEADALEEFDSMGVNLAAAFDVEWPEEDWLLRDLLPLSAKALMTAPAKAGKTTTIGSLVKALTRATPFFGQFDVDRPRRVVIIDTEMTQRKHVEWLKDVGIDPELVTAFYMRGQAHKVDLRAEAQQVRWARALKRIKAEVLILDPLSPVLAGLGLDENSAQDVQAFLAGVDSVITQAELHGAIVVHHHGHSGERGRGSSAFLGWPDAIWTLVKDEDDSRYFAALGRDIEVPESAVEYNEITREVTIPVVGAKRKGKAEAQKEVRDAEIHAYVRGNPGLTGAGLAEGLGISAATVGRALERLEVAGRVRAEPGARNSKLWRPV